MREGRKEERKEEGSEGGRNGGRGGGKERRSGGREEGRRERGRKGKKEGGRKGGKKGGMEGGKEGSLAGAGPKAAVEARKGCRGASTEAKCSRTLWDLVVFNMCFMFRKLFIDVCYVCLFISCIFSMCVNFIDLISVYVHGIVPWSCSLGLPRH